MPSSPARRLPGPDVLLPLTVGGMVLVLLFRPIHDVDIFWQVRLGELCLAQGSLVEAEPFSARHMGEPVVPFAWLGQVVLAAGHRLGGWPLLHVANAVAWALAFFVVARSTRVGGAAVLALGLAFVASLPFASLRPQTFAVLAFALLLALMRSGLSTWSRLLLAAPLLVAWQNLHPSVSVAAAAAGGAAAAGWVRRLWTRGGPAPWAETGVVVLSVLSSVATPAGFGLFPAAAYNARLCRELGVNEWLPLWSGANWPAAFPAWAALAATAVLLARRWDRVRATDLGVAVVLTGMLLAAYRFSPFWALAMIPVWAPLLAPAEPPPTPSRPSRVWAGTVGVLGVGAALGVGWLVRPPLFGENLPLAGVARLRESGATGVVYCHPNWGGPLIGAGDPTWRVSHDGRFYLYTRDEWQAYLDAAHGDSSLAEVEAAYQPAAFFLRRSSEPGLVRQLEGNPGWAEVHRDDQCVAFVRRTAPKPSGPN